MPNNTGVYIAFDFGLKRIGVAVGQTITGSANELPLLKADAGEPDWVVIVSLIRQWQPEAFIVGVPLNMNGTEQPITQQAKQFIAQLKTHFNIPVYQIDERLTTRAARAELFAAGGYKKLQHAAVDSYAAKLMLESWLREWV